jgi:hypothetical protein
MAVGLACGGFEERAMTDDVCVVALGWFEDEDEHDDEMMFHSNDLPEARCHECGYQL